MNVHIMAAAIFIGSFAFYSICKAGGTHHHNDHQPTKAKVLEKNNYSYVGNVGSKYTQNYRLAVNLNEIDSFATYKSGKESGAKMTPEQTEVVWSKLSDELPFSTDFKITKAEIGNNGLGYLTVRLEESSEKIKILPSDLIANISLDLPSASFGIHDETPALHSYVDTSKWSKETGYRASLDYLSRTNYPVMKATIIFAGLYRNGEPDLEGYNKLSSDLDIPISLNTMVKLGDGTRGVEKFVTPERLEALYQEPSVVNIIPNIDY